MRSEVTARSEALGFPRTAHAIRFVPKRGPAPYEGSIAKPIFISLNLVVKP